MHTDTIHTLIEEYASGNLEEPLALLAASYACLNADAYQYVKLCSDVGGSLLQEETAAPVTPHCLQKTLKAIENKTVSASAAPAQVENSMMPVPLQPYLQTIAKNGKLPWKRYTKGFRKIDLAFANTQIQCSLMGVGAGCKVPHHHHEGAEYMLVLQGGIQDNGAKYHRGDLLFADEKISHAPQALPEEECICLVVTTGKLHFTNGYMKIFNYFIK